MSKFGPSGNELSAQTTQALEKLTSALEPNAPLNQNVAPDSSLPGILATYKHECDKHNRLPENTPTSKEQPDAKVTDKHHGFSVGC